MTIRRIGSGTRMSQAVIHGNTVVLSGQVSEAKSNRSVGEQMRDILAQIDKLLAAAGSDKTKLLRANIWLADMATFDEMNEAWDAWVAPGCAPARATVEAKLAAPEFGVEIMVEAALD